MGSVIIFSKYTSNSLDSSFILECDTAKSSNM